MAGKYVSLGGVVEAWMEEFLVMGPGDYQGEPFRLDPDMRNLLWDCYEYEHVDGQWRRRYDRGVYSRPKGAGKSFAGAAIACAELAGPARLDFVRPTGEPVGKPVVDAGVLIIATELGQATVNTFEAISFMLEEGKAAEHYGIDIGSTRILMPDGGWCRPVTAKAKSKEGGRETFAVFDETHIMDTPELKSTVAVVRRNLTKRKRAEPWSLETTTAFRPGDGSVAEDSAAYAKAVEMGNMPGARLLWDHREGRKDLLDLTDDGKLLEELRYAYADRTWTDYGRIINELRDPATDHSDGTRYFLNRSSAASDQWVVPEEWQAASRPDLTIPRGEIITVGIDGAYTSDWSVIAICDLETAHVEVFEAWGPVHGDDEWTLPLSEVDLAVRELFRDYIVGMVYIDPPYLQGLIPVWQEDLGKSKVQEWWTNRDIPMAHALERFSTGIQSQDVTHPGTRDTFGKVFTEHVMNARIYRKRARVADPDGKHERKLIRKPVKDGYQKIDAAVAATLALEARADVLASGRRPRKRSQHAAAGF